jgi:hypothetical protein
MDLIERADTLRLQAEYLLATTGLNHLLPAYGRVQATGSYFLDVMVHPDVDLYVSPIPLSDVFVLGEHLAHHDLVYEIVIQKPHRNDLPNGFYLKARLLYGDWDFPWKIDIWFLTHEDIDQRMARMWSYKQRMTPSLRQRIVQYKYSILTKQHRTPMYSGLYIYEALIDKGITAFDEVTTYLVEHGIRIE